MGNFLRVLGLITVFEENRVDDSCNVGDGVKFRASCWRGFARASLCNVSVVSLIRRSIVSVVHYCSCMHVIDNLGMDGWRGLEGERAAHVQRIQKTACSLRMRVIKSMNIRASNISTDLTSKQVK